MRRPKPLGGVTVTASRRRAASQRQRLHRRRWIVPLPVVVAGGATSCAPSASAMWSRPSIVAAQRGTATATSRCATMADINDQLPAQLFLVADPLAREARPGRLRPRLRQLPPDRRPSIPRAAHAPPNGSRGQQDDRLRRRAVLRGDAPAAAADADRAPSRTIRRSRTSRLRRRRAATRYAPSSTSGRSIR